MEWGKQILTVQISNLHLEIYIQSEGLKCRWCRLDLIENMPCEQNRENVMAVAK